MKRYSVALAATLALVGAAPAASSIAASPASSSIAASPTAQASCTRALIAGQSKCIARGQFCKRTRQAMRDYRRYGLSCTKRDVNGRYHLQ